MIGKRAHFQVVAIIVAEVMVVAGFPSAKNAVLENILEIQRFIVLAKGRRGRGRNVGEFMLIRTSWNERYGKIQTDTTIDGRWRIQ